MTLGLSPSWSVNWKTKEIAVFTDIHTDFKLHHAILHFCSHKWRQEERGDDKRADLFEEPGNQGAQDECVVGLSVVVGQADAAGLPQVTFPAVQVPGCRTDVKQDHIGAALDQPAAKMNLQHQHQQRKPTERSTILEIDYQKQIPVCLGNENLLCEKILAQLLTDTYFSGQYYSKSSQCIYLSRRRSSTFKILLKEKDNITHSVGFFSISNAM